MISEKNSKRESADIVMNSTGVWVVVILVVSAIGIAFLKGFGQEAGSKFFNWVVGLLSEEGASESDIPDQIRSRKDYFLEHYERINHLFHYDANGETVLETPDGSGPYFAVIDRAILLYVLSRLFAVEFDQADEGAEVVDQDEVLTAVDETTEGIVRNAYSSFDKYLDEEVSQRKDLIETEDGFHQVPVKFKASEGRLPDAIDWILSIDEFQDNE